MIMKKQVLLFLPLLISVSLTAQVIVERDPEVENMVAQISRDSMAAYIKTLVSFRTRNTLSATTGNRGIGAAREWVVGKFRAFAASSNGRMSVEPDRWTQPKDSRRVDTATDMINPMAFLKGTDTADKRIFVISGHLDSRATDVMSRTSDAPGANDDGSGVAVVLECARIMSKHQFSATVLFVTVTGEEQGLLGSEHLARRAKDSGWNIQAVLNNDIIGSNNSSGTNIIDNTRVRIFSEGLPAFELDKKASAIRNLGMENDGSSRQLSRYVREMTERYVPNLEAVQVYRSDRFLRGGDHFPFQQNGFAAVRITEMNENYEHQHQDVRIEKNIQYGDLEEFLDLEYLSKNGALNLATLSNLAKSPGAPRNVTLDTRALGNFTALSWTAPASGKPKGYYVLLRETSQPQWQKKFFTTNAEMRLPYSKDNYFFAVQSVSASGNESLPVVPEVAR